MKERREFCEGLVFGTASVFSLMDFLSTWYDSMDEEELRQSNLPVLISTENPQQYIDPESSEFIQEYAESLDFEFPDNGSVSLDLPTEFEFRSDIEQHGYADYLRIQRNI